MSLRLRLTLLNAVVLVLAIAASAGIAYFTQARRLQDDLDSSLRDRAHQLALRPAALFDPTTGELRNPAFLNGGPGPRRLAVPDFLVQLVDRRGTILIRSTNLGDSGLPASPDLLQTALGGQEWFADVEVDGQALRLLVAPLLVGSGTDTSAVGMVEVARPLAPLRSILATLQMTSITIGALAVLIALLSGWLLARAALRPIHQLAATAQAIGDAQDFGQRVPIESSRKSRDEVGQLAAEFNRMLARLQAAYGQLEAALAAQRRFVADASHELRTPLTSLRGNVDLLQRIDGGAGFDRPGLADERQLLLADMESDSERMAHLVSDLLLLAQADAGQHLRLEPFEIGPVVRDAFRASRFLREGVDLCLGPVLDGVTVEGDCERVRQLVLILLDNALKYSPVGGQVTLSSNHQQRGEQAGVVIRVTDTGPGIPPSERERIFDRFARADAARTTDGAGLGLAIARWIVEEHHGAITVSNGPGRTGSVFDIWLPGRASAN